MLQGFLYQLRQAGVPVSTHEWLALMQAMSLGLHESSLDGFYRLARTLCVKDLAYYDAFDQAFLAYFKDVHQDALALTQELLDWLDDPKKRAGMSPEELALLQALNADELKKLFEERLREQQERHDGGNKWIGTGGTSPFGSGASPFAGAASSARKLLKKGRAEI